MNKKEGVNLINVHQLEGYTQDDLWDIFRINPNTLFQLFSKIDPDFNPSCNKHSDKNYTGNQDFFVTSDASTTPDLEEVLNAKAKLSFVHVSAYGFYQLVLHLDNLKPAKRGGNQSNYSDIDPHIYSINDEQTFFSIHGTRYRFEGFVEDEGEIGSLQKSSKRSLR